MNDPKSFPIPDRMKGLPRDKRGFPVPCIVQYDAHGVPQFTVNNALIKQQVMLGRRCGICGGELGLFCWSVGGPNSAFHPNGAYIDPPMHRECLVYAMNVCPYLAWRSYSGKANVDALQKRFTTAHIVEDTTTWPGRPKVFVAVSYRQFKPIWENGLIDKYQPIRPYRRVEFWHHGKRITQERAVELLKDGIMEWGGQPQEQALKGDIIP